MIDIKKIQSEAVKEFNEERSKKAKEKIKVKLHDIARAEAIVANLQRELGDLYEDISRESL